MIKKILYLMIAFLCSFSFMNLQPVMATESVATIVVDDTVVSENEQHHFIYHGMVDSDSSGSHGGWVADNRARTNVSPEAKTQHWVWANYDIAKSQTYDFTFVGTGVELVGLKSNDTPKMAFQLDEETVQELNISGQGGEVVTLYKRENISAQNARHTVKVTLPQGGKGLQVSYANVFVKQNDATNNMGNGSTVTPPNATNSTDRFIVVDDTATNESWPHHFSYLGGMDLDQIGGSNGGWVADTKDSLKNNEDPSGSQHWVWSAVEATAKAHTYKFTFVGSGVELVGVKNDARNTFQLDDQAIQTMDILGSKGSKTVLYTAKNLPIQSHTVTVTLPSGTGLQISYAKVFDAPQENPVEKDKSIKEVITPNMQTDTQNVFRFTDYGGSGNKAWNVSAKEAWIDLGGFDDRAEQTYYEIPFVGNRIDLIAIKASNHGKVRVTIDGKEPQEVDLYASSRTSATMVYSKQGLSEGEHILKVVTLNSKSGSNIVNEIVRAEIYHKPYLPTSFEVVSEIAMVSGQTQLLEVDVLPSYVKDVNINYESSAPMIADVDQNGMITAKGIGHSVITVTVEGLQPKTINVNVQEQVKDMTGSIVDENKQWTQDKKEVVKNLDVQEKNLASWKNDKAISEFVIYAKESSLENVTVTVSDFTSGFHVLSKNNIKATFVKSTKAYTGMPGWNNHPEHYPTDNGTNRKESSDILFTTEPINIGFDMIQPVWVEITVPKDTVAGEYTGTVEVHAEGTNKNLQFTFHLNVANVELPDATTFQNSFDIELWQYPYSSAEYYGYKPFSSQHLEVLKKEMELYKSIGGNAITATITEDAWDGQTYSKKAVHYPSMVKWKLVEGSFDRNGTISDSFRFEYDFSDFDAWISLNKELGLANKIALYGMVPWHGNFTYYVGNELRRTPFRNGSDTYTRVWQDFFRKMIEHLDEKGWFDDTYVGIDERGITEHPFDLLDTIQNKEGKTLKTTGAMDGIAKGNHAVLAKRITELTVGDTVVQTAKTHQAFVDLLKYRSDHDLKTTLYSCTGHIPGNFSLSAPAESYWSMMYAYKNNTKGFLRWAYDAWVENPLEDATHSSFETGDAFLIYPSIRGTNYPDVKSSIRLSKMAQGIRDINKLILMEKKVPQLKADIDELLNHVQTTYPHDNLFLTDIGKDAVATDMNYVHDKIDEITAKYLQLLTRSVDVTGIWHDENGNVLTAQEAPLKSISVQLYKNGVAVNNQILELTEAKNWHGSFENVLVYDGSGEEISYTIKEINEVQGMIQFAKKDYMVSYGGDMLQGLTVVNKLKHIIIPATPTPSVTPSSTATPKPTIIAQSPASPQTNSSFKRIVTVIPKIINSKITKEEKKDIAQNNQSKEEVSKQEVKTTPKPTEKTVSTPTPITKPEVQSMEKNFNLFAIILATVGVGLIGCVIWFILAKKRQDDEENS